MPRQQRHRPSSRTHATALVKALTARAEALGSVDHRPTKGVLREALLDELLRYYLTPQFSTGTGLIINSQGDQSHQVDIVIYDTRAMVPLIKGGRADVFPWESVIATIEVKSCLRRLDILESDKKARFLSEKICGAPPILSYVFGFFGDGPRDLMQEASGRTFFQKETTSLTGVCLLNRYSWMRVQGKWVPRFRQDDTCEETKRFIAVALDNIRTLAEARWMKDGLHHRDWLGSYIRDQD